MKSSLTALLLLFWVCSCNQDEDYKQLNAEHQKLVYALLFRHNPSVVVDKLAERDEIEKLIPTERVPEGNAWTPLAYASFIGNQEVVKLLVAKKANIHCKDQNGNTPILLASLAGSTEVMGELLRAGANVNDVDANGMSTLIIAAAERNAQTVKYLTEHGCNLGQSVGGMNATDFARFYNHQEVKQYLESKGLSGNRYSQ